jgi:hypothetical protein
MSKALKAYICATCSVAGIGLVLLLLRFMGIL